jgi:hypothetical protein
VIELRFHEELYDGFAIDEAVKLYEPYAAFTLAREAGGYAVKLESKPGDDGGADEALIAAEFANYALGKTIERARDVRPALPSDVQPALPGAGEPAKGVKEEAA